MDGNQIRNETKIYPVGLLSYMYPFGCETSSADSDVLGGYFCIKHIDLIISI